MLIAVIGFVDDASSQSPKPPAEPQFSATLVKQTGGKRIYAQVFAKGDRLRLEYRYALRTERGYAAIEIVRPDQGETWYVLAQRKELLVSPLNRDEMLPIGPALPGERSRVLVGDAMAAGRLAHLYDVQIERNGREERYYEWVDQQAAVVLKLVSRDRDWSIEYERFHLSPQPDSYFEEPAGYIRRRSSPGPRLTG